MSAVIGILVGLLVLVRVIGRQVTGSLVTQKANLRDPQAVAYAYRRGLA